MSINVCTVTSNNLQVSIQNNYIAAMLHTLIFFLQDLPVAFLLGIATKIAASLARPTKHAARAHTCKLPIAEKKFSTQFDFYKNITELNEQRLSTEIRS